MTFADLSIDKSGAGYKLTASSAGLDQRDQQRVQRDRGCGGEVAVHAAAGGGTGGVAWATQPKVTIQDAFDNTVTTSTASVTLAITAGTGTSGAVLTCTANPKAAAAGVDPLRWLQDQPGRHRLHPDRHRYRADHCHQQRL